MEVQMTEQLYWIIFEVPSNYCNSTQPRVGSLKFVLDYLVNEFNVGSLKFVLDYLVNEFNVLIKVDHDTKFYFMDR